MSFLDIPFAGVTKAQVGLGNVDNTSDANKPISDATRAALNGKADGAGEAQKWAGWRNAVNKMGTETVRWLAIGDSITEGTGVTARADTYPYIAAAKIRDAYPTIAQNTKDSRGWSPVAVTSTTLASPWTITGTNNVASTFGFRRTKAVQLTGAGATITGTVTGTAIDVWYTTGSATAAFTVSVDGGAGTAVGGSSASVTDGNVARINLGASGSHTVTITRGAGDCFISGVTVYDGNEAGGIVAINAGWHGSSTTNWANPTGGADWKRSVATLNPQLVTICLGTNDYALTSGRITYTDNIKTIVGWIRDNVAGWPTIVLMSTYKQTANYTPAWEQYEYGLEMAAADLGCAYLDLRTTMPDVGSTAGTASGYYYDTTHPSAGGNDKIATELAALLLSKAA